MVWIRLQGVVQIRFVGLISDLIAVTTDIGLAVKAIAIGSEVPDGLRLLALAALAIDAVTSDDRCHGYSQSSGIS